MLHDEPLLTLSQLAKLVPGRPHSSSIWRWCRKGIKTRAGGRICLEHIRAGARVYTSLAAYHRFGDAVAKADAEHFKTDAGEQAMAAGLAGI